MTRSFSDTLREASDFFAKCGRIYDALHKITRFLRGEEIGYAVIGGLALVEHGYVRFTEDVDLAITAEDLDAVHQKLLRHGYAPVSRTRRHDVENDTDIDFVVVSELPEVVHSDGYNVITLPKLIDMKLIWGRPLGRLKHLADVQELIKIVKLPRELGEQLDPSVRDQYYRLWDDAQNGYDPFAE